MAKNRARDARRVAKSIRTHEATMSAYGNAAVAAMKDPTHFLKPEGVRDPNSRSAKVDRQYNKGLITEKERQQERFESGIYHYTNKGQETFHKGLLKPVAQYQKEKDKMNNGN